MKTDSHWQACSAVQRPLHQSCHDFYQGVPISHRRRSEYSYSPAPLPCVSVCRCECVKIRPPRQDHPLLTTLFLKQILCPKLQDVVQLPLRQRLCGCTPHARPHDQMGEHHLPLGNLRDTFLNGASSHESIDHDLVSLSYSVCSAKGLGMGSKLIRVSFRCGHTLNFRSPYLYVVMRIPVRVIYDDSVRRGQIDTQSPSPG